MKAATHKDATRFAPSLLRRALATVKSFTIDNIIEWNLGDITVIIIITFININRLDILATITKISIIIIITND